MPSEPSLGRYRWRRVIAASGVLTSLVALGAIGHDGQPGLVSLWLLCAGLGLAALSLHAVRKERRASELLARRQQERDQADSRRLAAEARSNELAETSPDIVIVHGPDGRMVSISFADTGTGIKPEHLQRIFDLYFTTKDKGSGIGLSMVYRTVQMHDGEIEVQSTPGVGTTFRVLLPQA